MPKTVIKTNNAELWIEDDILHCKLAPGSEVGLEHAEEIMRKSLELTNGKKIPVLGDLSEVKWISREARECLSGGEAMNVASSLAILTLSPIGKVIGNFFLGLNKPPYPVRLFNSEEKALEWLKMSVKEKESSE